MSVARPGEPVTVSAAVRNIGGSEGAIYANLFVSGILADSKEVRLTPGQEATVSFPVTFSRTGIQEVSIGNLTPIRVKVYTEPMPVLWLNFYSGGWGRGEATVAVPDGWNRQWHYLCGVVEGQVLKLYVDGELLVTQDVEGNIGHTDFPWMLGANGERTGRPTNGYIDDARIYLEPLTQEEIQQIIESFN